MDSVVPQEVTAELTQILSNLVLGDNQIRSNAENAVNERLAQTPELYLLALAQFATAADTEVMRSFSLVLLRRLLFRPTPHHSSNSVATTLYDHLSAQTLATLERLLLHSLIHEPVPVVRRKAADTVSDVANHAMRNGRPWHGLQTEIFRLVEAADSLGREISYRVFTGSPNIILDLQVETVIGTLQRGLEDRESIDVRLAALGASVEYLSNCDEHQQAQSLSLMYPILNTLPSVPHNQIAKFLSTLTPLTTCPDLFAPHLPALLSFVPTLLLPSADPGPTPTISKPYPTEGSFTFDFPPENPGKAKEEPKDEEGEEIRKAALEFMVSLSESKPSMVKRVEGWIPVVIKGCLEGMGELEEDSTPLWLEADPSDDPTDDTYPQDYEQALDRMACACGGETVLPSAFQQIPAMLASHDWRQRHAGLMAIAAMAEGTSQVMQRELGIVVDLVTPRFEDSHPRVRHAACQCIGQLCTDLEEVIQAGYHQQIFAALIPTLEAPEARVHSHAAAALINFCEGSGSTIIILYLDAIVERLLKLLNPPADSGKQPKRYVQEQVVTSLAMVADVSERGFAKHYPVIMPLLLSVLQNAKGSEYHKLRLKAMECAGLIAIAVGRDVFREDSRKLCELLMQIQNSPVEADDTLLNSYLIASWAKICQALGPEFEPYLPVVMPPLLQVASAKADVSVIDEEDERYESDAWTTIKLEGQSVGIKSAVLEEKCQALEMLLVYVSTLGGSFAPYLAQSFELVLPALRFYFHVGVQETAALLMPRLLLCGKNSGTLTNEMVTATFTQLVNCIGSERDINFLSSLYKCFTGCMNVIGGATEFPPQIHDGVMEGTRRQLQSMADKRKKRSEEARAPGNEDKKELLMWSEEVEDYALDEMTVMLKAFSETHELLMAVSSVRDLGVFMNSGVDDAA